jgi:type I restriction enzyme M protein
MGKRKTAARASGGEEKHGRRTKPPRGDRNRSNPNKSCKLDTPALETWLWDAACVIRGAVDAPKFKDYILPLIFIKRLSDVFEDELTKLAGPDSFGNVETAWEMVEAQPELVRFFIPRHCTWPEIRKLTKDIGQSLTDAVRDIADQNERLQGVIDIVDFNATVSGERIIPDERLSALIEIISRHRIGLADTEPDIIGRAYEYLIRKFAEGQGQSAGEFYTPREVGLVLAYILGPKPGQTVYDPACGSAGLLIKSQLVCRENHDTAAAERPLQLFGQEMIPGTYAMAQMNMIIHDMTGDLAIGDTLRNPKFLEASELETFDLVVANPMWNQDGYDAKFYDEDPHQRFTLGYAPASTADWGWVQHMHASLTEGGRAGVVLDTGAASRGSGNQGANKERDIRKKFVDADLVEAVVLLPENLFYNTTAPGILMLFSRGGKRRPGEILLVNASKLFSKGRPKNFLEEGHVRRIADVYHGWRAEEGLSAIITVDQAAKNDYNLSPSRYVSTGAEAEILPLDEAVVLLREAEEERAEADRQLNEVLTQLGFGARTK